MWERRRKKNRQKVIEEREKVFCLWKIWAYGLQLQEYGRRGTDPGVLK